MDRLVRLATEYQQSPWLDNLKRGYITSGQLQKLVDRGIRGLTSNPTIFQKAIQGSPDYDEQFSELVKGVEHPVLDDYWSMVLQDINSALDIFEPVYEATGGLDGFASVEVAPGLAHDVDGTIAAARELHQRVNRKNLMVKIPATEEGIPAIKAMIAEGRCINVTLIFSLDRYQAVIEAYISGARGVRQDRRRRSLQGLQRRQLLHQPCRHRDRPPARSDRHRRSPVAQGQGCRRPGQAGLRPVRGRVQRPPVGGAGRQGCPPAAPAVGLDEHQEPGLPRHVVRR